MSNAKVTGRVKQETKMSTVGEIAYPLYSNAQLFIDSHQKGYLFYYFYGPSYPCQIKNNTYSEIKAT